MEVLFEESPLNTLTTFVQYCQYLYSSGSMDADLYRTLSEIRKRLRDNADRIEHLTEALRIQSPGCLPLEDEAELKHIEDLELEISRIEHIRKRNQYTLSISKDNENTCNILHEVC